MYQLFHPPKKLGRQIPSIFCTGYPMDAPENAQIFAKIWRLVFEKFFKTENIFSVLSFTGGPDAKILFLSTQRPPTAQKILSPPGLPFWRYKGSKFQLSHLFPQNWAARSPPYFAQNIIGMTPKNLKVSWKSREQFPRYLAFYSPTLSPT